MMIFLFRTSASSKVGKGKSNSAAVDHTVAGPFHVHPSSGIVDAKSEIEITVECAIDSPGLVREVRLIKSLVIILPLPVKRS